jgi:microcystin-dependent protein
MAFIVPNATATGASKKFISINQAEPDSVDLESLGNTRNFIRSGGAVTVSGTNSVSTAAGVAVIQGVPYSFNASTVTETLPASNSRFDLLVVRLTGTTAAVTVITGTADPVNPTLPPSSSALETGSTVTDYYNPTTDAVLASIYLVASTNLDTSSNYANIVDKRILSAEPLTYTSASAPTHSAKDVVGDTVVYNGATYIKTAASTWAQIATTADTEVARMPIGGIFAFAGTHNTSASPNSSYYMECDGRSLSTTTYSALHDVIGYSFGGSGGAFNIPNLTGDTGVVGASPAEMTSTKVASTSNTATLAVANMPAHNHGNVTIDFGTKAGTGTFDNHNHYILNGAALPTLSFVRRKGGGYPGSFTYIIPADSNGDGVIDGLSGVPGGMVIDEVVTTDSVVTSRGVTVSTVVGSASGAVPSQGTGTSFSIVSKSLRVRWYIRYA